MGIAIVFGILLSYPISIASGVMIFLEGEFDMTAAAKSLVVCLVIIRAILYYCAHHNLQVIRLGLTASF